MAMATSQTGKTSNEMEGPMTQDRFEYVSENQLTDAEIAAGERSGQLKLWRVDADGRRWFVRQNCRPIHGVPDSAKEIVPK